MQRSDRVTFDISICEVSAASFEISLNQIRDDLHRKKITTMMELNVKQLFTS